MNMDKNGVPYTYNHVADKLKNFRANVNLKKTVNANTYTLNNLDTVASGVYLLMMKIIELQKQ